MSCSMPARCRRSRRRNSRRLAPRAVLVADDIDGPATGSARERLLSAGFPNVSVLASAPDGPEFDAGGNRAAA